MGYNEITQNVGKMWQSGFPTHSFDEWDWRTNYDEQEEAAE